MKRSVPLLSCLTLIAACSDGPSPVRSDFVLAVGAESFVLRAQDAETVRRALGNLRGENRMFPIGPLRPGDGGFNAPWSWHLDPEQVRFTEAAIELCDGTPSYVEAHREAFPTYCPWSARVVALRPAP